MLNGTHAVVALALFGAGSATPQDPPRVVVSQEEVRVVLPPVPGFSLDPTQRVDCAEKSFRGDLYRWTLGLPEAVVGPRGIAAVVGGCRPFESWHDVAESARAGIYLPGMFLSFQDTPVEVRAEGDTLVLLLTDGEAIMELFGLRPESLVLRARQAGEPVVETEREVAVDYVEPAIPMPDSALFARAARLRAEDRASRRGISRHIDADDRGAGRLWVVLGDSIQLWVEERVCNIDVCAGHTLLPPDDAWAIDDPAVATLRFVDPDVSGLYPPQPLSRAFLHGRSPGRTVVRATGLESPRDTLMARTRPEPSAEQEVQVTRRPASVEITVPTDTVEVGETGWVRVTLRDENGAEIQEAPVTLTTHNGSWRRLRAALEEVDVLYDRPGVWYHEVTLGEVADTVFVRVR